MLWTTRNIAVIYILQQNCICSIKADFSPNNFTQYIPIAMCLKTFVKNELKYNFKENRLLEEALVTSGVVSGKSSIVERQGNRRLALIGDALIRLELVHNRYLEGATLGKSKNHHYER